MQVEILYFEACPNWEETLSRVREAAAIVGCEIDIRCRPISSDAEASASLLAGSSTVLVDGSDAFDDAVQVDELACRVYRTDSGFAGSPTVEHLVSVLRARRGPD
ncbi:hypothetical protein SAMN04488550_2402 [Gordonia malaquae]|uniref:Alkylmercury lyase n=1 Tax=Gordonia malaquae NBRC 108250 TaxID=1223542 RepID=M3UGK9_GORML|nr:hypothetical protein GM1_003_01590 [Gordonia malaquae NBRC 108250]GAC82099.1 hypothetical protein GM1_077_00010 [Gordonia malaquae NBRC 108250]SED36890.1 hypothetical protein SAMN04488550_2402 [Gordonia malaquae]